MQTMQSALSPPPEGVGHINVFDSVKIPFMGSPDAEEDDKGVKTSLGARISNSNTILKTSEIVRRIDLPGEGSPPNQYDRRDAKNAEVLRRVRLYGRGVGGLGKKHKPKHLSNAQLWAFGAGDAESAMAKVRESVEMRKYGLGPLEQQPNELTAKDLRYLLETEFKLALTREETAALVTALDAKRSAARNDMVDNVRFYKAMQARPCPHKSLLFSSLVSPSRQPT
jgi:hypothetical protein